MYRWAYQILSYVVAPFYGLGLGWSVRRHIAPSRYVRLRLQGPPVELSARPRGQPLLWLHAVSVGEVLTAIPLLQAWLERHPDWTVLLTTATPTGHAVARRHWSGAVAYLPLDLAPVVRRWMNRLQPTLVGTVETEIWPNLFWQARDRSVPVAIVNGRISDQAFRRYGWARPFMRWVLDAVQCVCVQSDRQAERFRRLGVRPETLHVTGNLKFDAVIRRMALARVPDWLDRWRAGRPLVVFGSWTAPEWSLLRDVVVTLVRQAPEARFLVAPRHIEVAAEWADTWRAQGLPVGRRTVWQGEDWTVMILDTLGELAACYGGAAVAVVGGSFHPSQAGHNPIEPAWWGVPVVIGPFHRDFLDVIETFQAGGGIQVLPTGTVEALQTYVGNLLREPAHQAAWGQQARRVVLQQGGALDRTLTCLEALVRLGG
ncbi:MAG: hypothetical protein NZ742_02020 [Acidobacteria bacterium]|nr:hypothetical protein [Acidobacteriota bacterium]MDW7983611.1 glycosyltransferase N-terminal domain-containing protein [Acidobacteriota bacterium]